jgi:outer membrane receptor protein involved in Fe transport
MHRLARAPRRSRAALHVRLALVALCAAVPGSLRAQTLDAGSITGTVTTPAGAPLSDVTVYAPTLRRGSTTQIDGRFHLGNLPAGRVQLVAQRVGLVMDTVSVMVQGGTTVQLQLRLREAATVVAPVVVSATRELQRRSEGSITIDALGAAEIRQTRASHPKELMNRLAGVHVSDLSGEGHSMAIRQPITTKPMYLYLEDGIPTRATGFFNHNALYEVNLPQAAGVEVIKGPGTALYGSDAIGGVVNVLTRTAPLSPEMEASVEGGAFGYRRLLASGGSTCGNHGVRADVNVTHGDNWKSQAPFDRQSGTLRWDAVLGGGAWTAKTVVTGTNVSQQDVPALSTALFDTATTTNLAPIAYRKVKALRMSTEIARETGRSLWSVTGYGRFNEMQLLPSWQLSYDPQTYETTNRSAGFLARYRRDFTPLAARLILGTDGDWSPGRFVAARAITSRSGPYNAWQTFTSGESQYDYDVTYHAISPYLHVELSPISRLRLDAGVRADLSGYAYHTLLAPVDTGSHRRPTDTRIGYAHVSPKLGAALDVGAGQSLFASYRHGFRAPSQGQLFTQGSAEHTVDLSPVKVDSWEAGIRGQAGARLVYQAAVYDMTIHDDIVTYTTPENTREARNAGLTRHRGVEVSSGVAVTTALRVDVAWSVSNQRYVSWTPQAARAAANGKPAVPEVSYAGREIEQAPRNIGSVLLAYSPRSLNGGRLAAEWSHLGPYATDPANTHSYAGYDQLNVHASAAVTSRTELFARVVNLTNRKYAELLTYDNFLKEQYTPGAPRSLVIGMQVGR